MSKKEPKKYKRPPIDWYYVVSNIYDDSYELKFHQYLATHPRLNLKRCAYYYFKRTHSTTIIKNIRKLKLKGFSEEWIVQMLNRGW